MLGMDKTTYYENYIYKIANTSLVDSAASGLISKKQLMLDAAKNEGDAKSNKAGAVAGAGMRGAAKGVGGTAAALAAASLLSRKKLLGVPSKALKEMSKGTISAFNPKSAVNAVKNVKSFNDANAVGKGVKALKGGKRLARDYGTVGALGIGSITGVSGALSGKRDYELAQSVRDEARKGNKVTIGKDSKLMLSQADSYSEEIEKVAITAQIMSSFAAKSLGKKVATGAAIGAVGGALTAAPTLDEKGKLKTNRLKGALKGAVVGGTVGGSVASAPKVGRASSIITPAPKAKPLLTGPKVMPSGANPGKIIDVKKYTSV